MSSLMTGMIWKAKGFTDSERLLLLAIADEANSYGECSVPLQMLARKADMSLDDLELGLSILSSKKCITQHLQTIQLAVPHLTSLQKPAYTATPPPLETPKSATTGLKPLRSRVLEEGKKYREKQEKKQAKPRARNPLWDALVEVMGAPATKSETSDFAKTVKELAEAGAKPEDIAGFKAFWDREYTGATCTHRCYRQHWGKYATVLKNRVSNSNVLDL